MNARDVLVSLGAVVVLWIGAEVIVRAAYSIRRKWREWNVRQELKTVERQRLEQLRERQRERQAWMSSWGGDY